MYDIVRRHAERGYRNFRPFNRREAWMLYKWAALGEAVGWTLLILGIAAQRLPVWWHDYPTYMAGSVHGTLFLLYIGAVAATGPSMGWPPLQTLIGGLFSVPPYGSLIFEWWAVRHRDRQAFQGLAASVVWHQL